MKLQQWVSSGVRECVNRIEDRRIIANVLEGRLADHDIQRRLQQLAGTLDVRRNEFREPIGGARVPIAMRLQVDTGITVDGAAAPRPKCIRVLARAASKIDEVDRAEYPRKRLPQYSLPEQIAERPRRARRTRSRADLIGRHRSCEACDAETGIELRHRPDIVQRVQQQVRARLIDAEVAIAVISVETHAG